MGVKLNCIFDLFQKLIFFSSLKVSLILPGKEKNAFFFFFLLFRATPAAYGGSQARGPIRNTAAGLHHSLQQCQIQAPSVTYTAVYHNTRSLTHYQGQGWNPQPHCSQSDSFLLRHGRNSKNAFFLKSDFKLLNMSTSFSFLKN